MKTKISAIRIAIALIFTALTFNVASAQKEHKMVSPDKIQWMDAPPGLPKGAKIAVLDGDPGKAGMYTVRLKFPAEYVVPPHWHPADELITIISGHFKMGMGHQYSKSDLHSLRPGDFAVMPATMHHYATADRETVVQVSGMGPFEITYVDPRDDPRRK